MGSASPGVSAIAWRSPVTRDQLIDIVAFTLTGHVCGQCECSNRSGWNNPTVICACREAATAALTAIEAAGMLVVPRDDAVNVVASLAAAISIIERTPQARKAAMSDTAFVIMLDDYTKALAAGRAMFAAQEDSTSE